MAPRHAGRTRAVSNPLGMGFAAAVVAGPLSGGVAHAAPGTDAGGSIRVTAAPIVVGGELAETARARLSGALQQGLEDVGVTVVASDEADAGCADPKCLAEVGGGAQAVGAEVTVEGRDYALRLVLRDAEGRTVTREAACQICGLEEAATLLRDEAAKLAPKLQAEAPSSLLVSSDPLGAEVFVDGILVGITPYEGSVHAGAHDVRLVLPGYIAQERELAALAGGDERVEVTLEKVPQTRGEVFTIAGGSLLAAGAASLAGGITLLVLNHRPVPSLCDGFEDNIDANGLCRWRYDTLVSGAALTGIGGAAAIAGGALLGVAAASNKGRRAELSISPRGASATIRF